VNYGGPNGFHALVEAAHNLGIDVVYNHLGPNDLDLRVFDGWNQNNLGGIYFYNDARCATPWGQRVQTTAAARCASSCATTAF
jgi:1,4-alpha-glucan branching enzyme